MAKVTTDDLAKMIKKEFNRIDKRFDQMDESFDQKLNAQEDRIVKNFDTKLNTTEDRIVSRINHEISDTAENICAVIKEVDRVHNHEKRITKLETDVKVLKTAKC